MTNRIYFICQVSKTGQILGIRSQGFDPIAASVELGEAKQEFDSTPDWPIWEARCCDFDEFKRIDLDQEIAELYKDL